MMRGHATTNHSSWTQREGVKGKTTTATQQHLLENSSSSMAATKVYYHTQQSIINDKMLTIVEVVKCGKGSSLNKIM